MGLLIAPVASHTAIVSQNNQLHKQAFHSLAKCVAALTITSHQEAFPVVEEFLRDIQSPRNDPQHIFALLVIGEIGRHMYVLFLPVFF